MYLKKLAEEIKRRFEGGHPSSDSSLKYGEIKPLIVQVINRLFKKEAIQMHYSFGERIPPHSSLMTYTVDIEASGELIIENVCETFQGLNLADFWTGPDGQFWDTGQGDGDYWLLDITDSVITVTSVSSGVFTVAISGLAFDTGYDADDLVTWLGTCASTSYLELVGVATGSPYKFGMAGISAITALADGVSFTYTVSSSTNHAGDNLVDIQDSNTLVANLAGQGDTAISIANFRCCAPSSNTDYRKAQLTLPTQPINLPMGMGIFRVYDPKTQFSNYIPLSAGQFDLMNSIAHTNMNNVLAAETAYEWFDHKTLIFNQSVTTMPDQVNIQLVVADMDELGDYDLLPIPADYEEEVILEVLKILQPIQKEDVYVDQNQER